jgi:hypothetical protein
MADDNWVRRIGWWTLYGVAFGVIEATVVVYIRRLVGIAPGAGYGAYLGGAWAGFGTGSISDVLRRNGLLQVEMVREAATILLLIGGACGAYANRRQRLSLFCYSFAVWDLSYYLYLAISTGFPRSLAATDIYFLIPVSWVGPVWFPVLIAMPAMIWFSLWLARS